MDTAVDEQLTGRHGQIPVRRYPPPRPAGATTVVWVHGGGFAHGDLDMPESHAVAGALAAAGHQVVAVDYRLVPAVRHPVPVEDVLDVVAAVRAAIEPGGRLVIGGASAGACLSAAATMRTVGDGLGGPDGLILVYPTVHADLPPLSTELAQRTKDLPDRFTLEGVRAMNLAYAGGLEALGDPYAFPGGHDLTGYPATLIVDADLDTLRASGESFAAELLRAGVDTTYAVVPETTHGFMNQPNTAGFDQGVAHLLSWLDPPSPG